MNKHRLRRKFLMMCIALLYFVTSITFNYKDRKTKTKIIRKYFVTLNTVKEVIKNILRRCIRHKISGSSS